MVTLIGIILLALGLSLAVVWQTPVLAVLMGIIPLTLIFWGGLIVLIGYSEVKARREYRTAVGQGDDDAVPAADARGAKALRGRNSRPPSVAVSTSAPNPASTSPSTSAPQPSPPNHST
jgi:hypothetical protein